jgi:hypothetical protein
VSTILKIMMMCNDLTPNSRPGSNRNRPICWPLSTSNSIGWEMFLDFLAVLLVTTVFTPQGGTATALEVVDAVYEWRLSTVLK